MKKWRKKAFRTRRANWNRLVDFWATEAFAGIMNQKWQDLYVEMHLKGYVEIVVDTPVPMKNALFTNVG